MNKLKSYIAFIALMTSLSANAVTVEISGYRAWNGYLTGVHASGATPVQLWESKGLIMPLKECSKTEPCKIELPVGKHDLAICTNRVETCVNFLHEVKPNNNRIVYTETSYGLKNPVVLNVMTGASLTAFVAEFKKQQEDDDKAAQRAKESVESIKQ